MFHLRVLFILIAPLFPNLLLAKFTPPPSNISKYNEGVSLGVKNKTLSDLNVGEVSHLLVNRTVNKIDMPGGGGLDLHGDCITVGPGGIYYRGSLGYITSGVITSSERVMDIDINMPVGTAHCLNISAVISDAPSHKVGIRMGKTAYSHLRFDGDRPNIFTGDLEVIGNHSLVFAKKRGVVSVQRNLILRDAAQLHIDRGGQFSRAATVRMENAAIHFHSRENESSHILRKMIIEGESVIQFHKANYALESIALDDLQILWWGKLLLKSWREDGRTLLLVRKDSEHLQDALSKIKFEGWEQKRAGLREYNSDYWQIGPGFPEPATYGVILSAATLGLTFYRKQKSAALSYAALAKN